MEINHIPCQTRQFFYPVREGLSYDQIAVHGLLRFRHNFEVFRGGFAQMKKYRAFATCKR